MRTSSAMMNPFEYRETMWSILYEGDDPPPPKEKPRPALPAGRGRRGRRGPTRPPRPGPARKMSSRDTRALAAFNAEIAAIQAKRQSANESDTQS